MFNLGVSEMILLGVIALVVIGPKQLPELARTVAKMMNEFKRATGDLSREFMNVDRQARRGWEQVESQLQQPVEPEKSDKPEKTAEVEKGEEKTDRG